MLGRGKEGADIYKRIIADKDSAFSHNMTKQLDELNALFRLDELQMQNTLQRTRFAVVFILLTALALIGFLLYRFFAVRRMERLKAKSERMESELRVAHEIQLGMVPSVFPAFPDHPEVEIYASVTPAKEVGGDLYDYAIHGGHLYFCLGDVSGKGVPASLLMTTAINLFRVASRQQLAPVDIAMQMNETLTENNDSGMFVTLFIGKVDLKTGMLDFCNCGHNPPVIIAEGKPRYIEMKTNIPLGIVPGYNYQNETYGCITGKPFFLYTD
jgi:serine phosphatase RsbU (regulator of sigma subunit)